MPPVTIYLNHESYFILRLEEEAATENSDDSRDITSTLLSAAYAHRHLDIRLGGFAVQIDSNKGALPSKCSRALFDADSSADGRSRALVRDIYGNPYLFQSLLSSKPLLESVQKVYKGFEEDPEDIQYVAVSKLPRGPGLFHRPSPPQQPASTKPYSRVLPMNAITIDNTSIEHTELGLLIPSLIYYIEIYLIASELTKTLLAPLNLSNISMVVTAICASSAQTPTNFERIEFLGDSILKLCTTVNIAATSKFLFHTPYLS